MNMKAYRPAEFRSGYAVGNNPTKGTFAVLAFTIAFGVRRDQIIRDGFKTRKEAETYLENYLRTKGL